MDLASTAFEIIPFAGVGELAFGMTPKEAAAILGAPLSGDISRNYHGERVEYRFRADMVMSYNKEADTAVEFGFGPAVKGLSYMGQGLFLMPELHALRWLMNEDGAPYVCAGFVIFPKLGVSLTGFHDNDSDEKAIAVSQKGGLDGVLSRARHVRPFRLP
jgi:hypothetical protein